ncbi:MAG: PLP-dependent aminotransferase family protein [Pseudomonadota bacterium]
MAIVAESFILDPGYQGTLQQQLRQIVVDGVLSGRFRPGERLPSSRALARHLGISRITVTLAYTELVATDYLMARGRSGYFISEAAPRPPSFERPAERAGRDGGEPRVDWQRALGRRFSQSTAPVRPADWQRYPYPFIYGQPDPELFDYQNWRACALQALGQRDLEVLTSDAYERDDARLVEYILRHILPRRGIWARPQEILLTLGGQNALWLAAEVLLNQRRMAVMENPCYPGLRTILEQMRCHSVFVDVDDDGLPPERLPRGTDVLFVTASHQCPTNATMPVARRRALLERATEQGFIIVEDDYEFELSPTRAPSPALKSLDETGAVVYAGSFSKSLFPGLRLGYLVGDAAFIEEARALRALVLRHPPGHLQRTAAYFLSLGHYDAQVTRLSAAYARRREAMAGALAAHGLDTHAPRFGASSAWLRAPAGTDIDALAFRLRQRGVLIEPGQGFFRRPEEGRGTYRLGFSSIPTARIPPGIALLAEEMAVEDAVPA